MTELHSVELDRLSKRYFIGKKGSWKRRKARTGEVLLGRRVDGGTQMRAAKHELWALRDISLSVARGTILGIVGANGAGKTTLLKILAHVVPPTYGRAVLRGRVIPLLELGTAFRPEYTGRENVFLSTALYGISPAEVRRHFDAIVEGAGVEEIIDMPLSSYSAGMYLRLAFSTAVNMQPDVLLADEILAMGDLEFQQTCVERMEEEGAHGKTILLVSHDMAAIRNTCNRAIWIDAGRIKMDGEPELVVSAYEDSARRLEAAARKKEGENRKGRVLAARALLHDGRQASVFDPGYAFDVEVECMFERGDLDARCGLIFEAHGAVAFCSEIAEPARITKPGRYRFRASVPAGLLAETIYEVKPVLGTFSGADTELHSMEDALVLRMHREGKDRRDQGNGNDALAGVVSPSLEWKLHST